MQNTGRIIFALLITASLGVIYWYWSNPLPQTAPVAAAEKPVEAGALAARLAEEMKKDAPTDRERHILELAEADWRRNPFEGQRSAAGRQAPRTEPASSWGAYTYSGYLEVDRKRLAIISGMKYQVGDRLESGKYVVRSIEPEKVVVEDTDKREQLTLPFVGRGF